jgi:6-phosphogluconate dehydrogenase
VITTSLFERFSSRGQNAFAARVNAALRNQFGGHAVKAADEAAQADPAAE